MPKQSKHTKEAVELAKFLTSPAGQTAAFKTEGNLPSSPQALDDPAVKAATNEYFSNAPVGKIFAERRAGAQAGLPRPEEPAGADAVENALAAVRAGQRKTPTTAWTDAVTTAEAAGSKSTPDDAGAAVPDRGPRGLQPGSSTSPIGGTGSGAPAVTDDRHAS